MFKTLSMGVAITSALKMSSMAGYGNDCERPSYDNGKECIAHPCFGGALNEKGECECPGERGLLFGVQCATCPDNADLDRGYCECHQTEGEPH